MKEAIKILKEQVRKNIEIQDYDFAERGVRLILQILDAELFIKQLEPDAKLCTCGTEKKT